MPCRLLEISLMLTSKMKKQQALQARQGSSFSEIHHNQCLNLKQEMEIHSSWNSPVISNYLWIDHHLNVTSWQISGLWLSEPGGMEATTYSGPHCPPVQIQLLPCLRSMSSKWNNSLEEQRKHLHHDLRTHKIIVSPQGGMFPTSVTKP